MRLIKSKYNVLPDYIGSALQGKRENAERSLVAFVVGIINKDNRDN